jgi:hypothetical protein
MKKKSYTTIDIDIYYSEIKIEEEKKKAKVFEY